MINKTNLINWLCELAELAKADEAISISFFPDTRNNKFTIIGGWSSGFDSDDRFCGIHSKLDPKYVMCVKIAINEGPYAYTDYEIMNMPWREEEDVYDTESSIYDTDQDALADWLITTYETVCREYGDR